MSHSSKIVRVIKSRRLRSAGHVVRLEQGSSSFNILTGKTTGKRLLERSRHIWKENIKEIGINSRNCFDLFQDRDYWIAVVNAALSLRVP